MEVYFKIGEISEMFDISVRALHLYDKMGLFAPEYTDEATGYRYYTADQMLKLNTIVSFKKIGFSLAEIKKLYDTNFNSITLLDMLRKKLNFFHQQIDIAEFNIDNIQRMISSIEGASKVRSDHELTEDEKAVRMSKIVCIENNKLQEFFSGILWL